MTSLFLLSLLAIKPLPAKTPATPRCPPDAEIRRTLAVDGPEWRVACRVAEHGELQLAAMSRPAAPRSAPHLVVGVVRGDFHPRAELDLEGAEREEIAKIPGEDWHVTIGPAGIRGADWLRVELFDSSGEDFSVTQAVTSFFRVASGRVQHLWTGLGDREEVRFDACILRTRARFSLSSDGALVRARHSTRTLRRPGGLTTDLRDRTHAECIAGPSKRDTFPVDDDGLNADTTVSPELRARARANRLLFLRALRSPKALEPFVADSLALVDPLMNGATDGHPDDPEAGTWGIWTSGAFAYVVDSGCRDGLVWSNLRQVAGPTGAPLIDALREFHQEDLGAWIEPMNDYGGCHQPRNAEPALKRVAEAWATAPAELRAALRPYLVGELKEMAGYPCFCDPASKRAEVQAALERNAAIVEGMTDVGAEAARKLRGMLSGPNVHLGCPGPH